jgi:hypothetical protein
MSFALFVSRNRKRPDELCPGSTLGSEFLHNIDSKEVEVVDCDRPDFTRPPWLKGTPTLYEYDTQKTWTGHQAVRRLYYMSLHYAMAPPPSAKDVARPTHAQRQSAPPPQSENSDSVDDSIWSTQITPDIEESSSQEMEVRSDRKMNADDLQQAMSKRMMSVKTNANGDPPQTMNAPPPPPPALND